MRMYLLNVALAFMWAAWRQDFGPGSLVTGFVLGLLLMKLCSPLFRGDPYTRRAWALFKYVFILAREIYLSSVTIAKAVLFRRVEDINPNIVTLDATGMSPLEIMLLTHSITLTPGTTSVDVSADRRTIYVHAFDAADPQAVRDSIETALKAPILRFTR